MHPNRHLAILLFAIFATSTFPALAFKMGATNEYEGLERDINLDRPWFLSNEQIKSILKKSFFGDPIHEDMTTASKKMATDLPKELSCGSEAVDIENFLQPPSEALLGNSICCDKTADSSVCTFINDIRYKPFRDELPPLISGSRWNDDACHMTSRPKSRIGWAGWMVDTRYDRSSNLNYMSHFHDYQFLHAMASRAFKEDNLYLESTTETQHKIITWAEFAFRVAEGTIPADAPLNTVHAHLEDNRKRTFKLLFSGFSPRITVGQFFAGTTEFNAQHVRQIAAGSLLHTLQDSFSASHVERVNDHAPRLKERGKVIRFLDYQQQAQHLHGEADKRPEDATSASPEDFHPVSMGARLIACAAKQANTKSNWPKAKALMLEVLDINPANRATRASGGRFKKPEE